MTDATAALDEGTDDFDPAALQDGLLMHIEDVHERLRQAREQGPVLAGNPFLEATSPVIGPAAFTVLGHREVQQVLGDSETFSNAIYADVIGTVMGRTLLEMDGAEHRQNRALLSPAFRQRLLARWESELVEVVVNELISSFIGDGRADLVRQFTFAFPVQVIARLLGLPREDYPRFQRLSIALLNVVYDWDRGITASQTLHDYFATVLEERRAQPADDLISELATAEIDGERLTDEEIFAFLRLLLPAGVETTYRSSGNLLLALLSDPASLEEVRQDRALIPKAIEEGLRWEPPITSLIRLTVKDTELAGVAISAGSTVNVSVASANRDPARYADPDRFDLHRGNVQHMTFGHGPHLCLGLHLARMETRVALNALLDRLPNLRLDTDQPTPTVAGVAFRSPESLPVLFDAS